MLTNCWTARRRIVASVSIVSLICISGCGGGKADVSGKVTFQGKTLTSGTVIMIGSDGVAIATGINPDGTYLINGVRSGTVQIGVVSQNPARAETARGRGGAMRGGKGGSPDAPPPSSGWFEIPTKYEDPASSGLTAKISSGSSTYDIDLPP